MEEQKTTSFISVFIKGFFMFCGLVVVGVIIFYYVVLPTPPNRTNFKLYSMDKTQCISVITKGNNRYFINGEHKSIPKSDFVKVNIAKTSRIGDEIGVCWKTGKYEWELVNDKAIVIENKLDTLKYKFNTSWERGDTGTPNTKKYHKPNCGTIGLLNMDTFDESIILKN